MIQPCPLQSAQALTQFGGAGPGGVWFGNDNTIGWTFDTCEIIEVTHLGLNAAHAGANDGLSQAHRIGIWDNAGNLLFSTTVGPGRGDVTAGPWEYAAVTPTMLGLGRYVIGAQYIVGSPEWTVAAPSTTDPALSYVEFRIGTGIDLPFPDQSFETLFVGPNFQFRAVPEPGVWALLMLAGCAVPIFRIFHSAKASR